MLKKNMSQKIKSDRLTLRELISTALSVYNQCFKYILILGLWVYVPTNLVLLIVAETLDLQTLYATGNLSGALRFLMVTVSLAVVVLPLETAALTYLVRQKLESANIALEGMLEASLGNWSKLFVTALLYLALLVLGSFLIIPAIMLGVMFYFYANIVAVNKTSGLTALRQSAYIVKKRWWRTFTVLCIIGILEFAAQTIFGSAVYALIAMAFPQSDVVRMLSAVLTDMLGIAFKLMLTVYFFNLYYTVEQTVERCNDND